MGGKIEQAPDLIAPVFVAVWQAVSDRIAGTISSRDVLKMALISIGLLGPVCIAFCLPTEMERGEDAEDGDGCPDG